jgi:hypothetical protein
VRVFVTGTGRCGTTTFYHACQHIKNFTSGHETSRRLLRVPRFPDQHIECSYLVVPWIPHLIERYPDSRWVHLIRDREACVHSMATIAPKRQNGWACIWYLVGKNRHDRRSAELFYASTNALIKALIPPGSMTLRLEEAGLRWAEFWEWIGAEGNFQASLGEWGRKYNAGECYQGPKSQRREGYVDA